MEEQDQGRFLLAIVLSMVVLSLWMFLLPPAEPEGVPGFGEETVALESLDGETASEPRNAALSAEVISTPSEKPGLVAEVVVAAPTSEEITVVEMPLYRVEFTSLGGGIAHWFLSEYRSLENEPVELTMTEDEGAIAGLATPFEELGVGNFGKKHFSYNKLDDWHHVFSSESNGVVVRKTYILDPDRYRVELEIQVSNRSGRGLRPEMKILWPSELREENDFAQYELIAFQEDDKKTKPLASVGKPGVFDRFKGGEPKEQGVDRYESNIAWAGAQSRYFIAAIFPEDPMRANAVFFPAADGSGAITEVSLEGLDLADGGAVKTTYEIYIGPKEPERLQRMGSELTRTTDMGWVFIRPLVRAFRGALLWLNGIFGNFGISIIVITILLKIVTAPLTQGQMKSMKRMSELKPRLDALKEKFGDDRQAFGQAQMELFKKEGVNPLGGCFPMLLQLPVFLGLYFALQSMPLIMGGSMVIQQKLTPTPSMDPMQAKMMTTFLPLMMTFMFYQFPSGLVLYWLMNNLLTIGHTAWMHRGDHKATA
jgi:YidC/Oxa1 family membrane protein insertase